MYTHQGIIMHIAPYNPAYSHKLIEKWWVLVREINLKWCSVHVIIIIMAIEFTSHWDLFRNLYCTHCKYVNKNHFCCIIFNATKKSNNKQTSYSIGRMYSQQKVSFKQNNNNNKREYFFLLAKLSQNIWLIQNYVCWTCPHSICIFNLC